MSYYENCRSGQGKKNLFGQKEKGKKEKEQKNLKMRGKDDLRAQLRALDLTIFSLIFLLPPNIYILTRKVQTCLQSSNSTLC